MSKTSPSETRTPVVFIHLPRTGGTTFQSLLKNHFAPDEMVRVHNARELERLAAMSAQEKERLRFVSGHMGFAFDDTLSRPITRRALAGPKVASK